MGADWYIQFTQKPTEEVQAKIRIYEETVKAGLPVHPDLKKWAENLEYITDHDVKYNAPEKALGHIQVASTNWNDNDLISLEDLKKLGVTHIFLSCSY